MIVVDQDKCVGCGQCTKICHEACIELIDKVPSIDYEICSTCTQCIAICPQQALSWNSVPPVTYDRTRLPSPGQLDELFKQRRTIRFYKEDKIDRTLLKEIVGYGIYAPTNNYDLRAIVIDDPKILEELERIILQFVTRIYTFLFKPKIMFRLLRMITPTIDPKDKVKMESAIEMGDSFDLPAAAIIIGGDRRVALAEASAQYALYNMILYAQVSGIGSRLKGTGETFLDRSRAARERLGLQKHEHILGMLEMGHPAVKFRNKVYGKTLKVQWNES